MTDIQLIRQAERAGYAILWRRGRAYFARPEDEGNPRAWSFPFADETAAALAALATAYTTHALKELAENV